MSILRIILAIIAGYFLFAACSMLLVGLVMGKSGLFVVILGLTGLALVGLIAGWVARAIAGKMARIAGYVLAGLILVATLANLLMQLGAEPVWYKIGTLVLTAPAVVCVSLRQKT